MFQHLALLRQQDEQKKYSGKEWKYAIFCKKLTMAGKVSKKSMFSLVDESSLQKWYLNLDTAEQCKPVLKSEEVLDSESY